MPPQAWIALASLAFVLLLQIAATAFALGRLFQRMTQVESTLADRKADGDALIRLTVQMEHVETTLSKMGNQLEGVNRQLGNIAMNRVGHVVEIGSER